MKDSSRHEIFGGRFKPFDAQGQFQSVAESALRRSAVRGGGATILSGGAGLGIQIIATVVLARLLTPADFGVVAMVTAFSLLLVNVGLNGFTETVVQWEKVDRFTVSNLFWISIGTGAFLTLVFAAAGSLLARFYHNPLVANVAVDVSITIFLTSASVLHLSLLKRAMRFAATYVNDIIAGCLSVAVSILLAWLGWGYWALVAGAIVQPLSTTFGAWVLCPWVPSLPRRAEGTGSMVRFAVQVYCRFGVRYGTRNVDNLLVGQRFNAQALGLYKKAYDLFAFAAGQLTVPLTTVAVATLSRLNRDRAQMRRYLLKSLTVIALVGMGFGADLTLVGRDVIRLVLGPRWAEAGQIFVFFGPGIGVAVIHGVHGWIHLSIGRADRWLRWTVAEFVFTFLLFVLGLHWGPEGVAAAWSASFCILTIPALWYAGRPIQFGALPVVEAVWKFAAAALLAGWASVGILRPVSFLFGASSAGAAFEGIVVISGVFSPLYIGGVVVLHRGCAPFRQLAGLLRDLLPARGASTPAPSEPAASRIDADAALAVTLGKGESFE